ncbi:hypothetical protein [Kaistella sp. SH40-3]|uniref:hypothetical protein n=1 Tax=unclassified Kaistella TaxID=2762626 RepID=UPI00351E338B
MKNSDITTIKIYNTKGLLMKTMKGIQNLDTSELKSGYYVIEFLLKNYTIKRQFIEIGNLSKVK